MLNGISLFSGIGGLDLALNQWVRTVAYCEIDRFCQCVLLSRMADGVICNAPIFDDVKEFPNCFPQSSIDIIFGGFPCQDISIAGAGRGLDGERSGLFFEIVRLAKEIKPKFIFLENVPAITHRGGIEVVKILAALGYACKWCVVSAESVGANHKRERWFLLANASGEYGNPRRLAFPKASAQSADSNQNEYGDGDDERESEPSLFRVDDDVSDRLHRIKALGNAVVPKQAKKAFKILMGLKDGKEEKTDSEKA